MHCFKLVSLLALLSAGLLANSAAAHKSEDLFKKYPQNSEFTLSNGDVVDLPIHYYQQTGYVLMGTANMKAVKEVLKPHGLKPIMFGFGTALVAIYFVDNQDSSIGGYKEFFLMIAAKPAKSFSLDNYDFKNQLIPVPKKYYVHDISVDTVAAQLAGVEIWGLPKTIGDFNYRKQGDDFAIDLTTPTCEISAKLPMSKLGKPSALDLQLLLRSPRGDAFETITRGNSQITLRAKNTFTANKSTKCGRFLHNVRFKPLAWQLVSGARSVLLAPQ